MAIKKLVKLDHGDPQINRVQRNVEDVFSSVQLALGSGSLVQNLSGSLNALYGASSQTGSFDRRYASIGLFSAFSGAVISFTASADQRYVQTSSYAPFTAAIGAFTASQTAYNASVASATASLATFSASVNRFTGSADGRYTFTSSFNALTASLPRTYLMTSSLATQAVTGSLTLLSGNMLVNTTDSANGANVQVTNNLAAASFPTTYLGLTNALHDWRIYNNSSGHLAVYDNTSGVGAYRFRIDTAGNVGIGTTPNEMLEVAGVVRATGYRCRTGAGGSYGGNQFNMMWGGSSCALWIDTTNVGTISTTSDRRLKQNINSMTGSALNILGRLRPVTFNWRDRGIFQNDGKDHNGFIADELQQVIPTAVDGVPSGTMLDGSPAYQSLVPSEIDPFIVKAIQEISGSLSYLQTTVAALSASNAALAATIKILQGKPLATKKRRWLTFWKTNED